LYYKVKKVKRNSVVPGGFNQRVLLPMNRPTPDPSQEGSKRSSASPSVPLLGGVRGGFMVPMHDIKVVEAFHEPLFTNPNDE